MKDMTLLEEKDFFGLKKSKIIEQYGTKAAITDFAILLGGFVSNNYYIDGGSSLGDRTGYYWTKTDDGDNDARVVDNDGSSYFCNVRRRYGGIRPALPYSLISEINTNGVSIDRANDIIEVEYGYYPQTAVSKKLQQELELIFNYNIMNKINKTGKSYTTDSVKYDQYDQKFKAQQHYEYEYKGKKYVRVTANSCFDGANFTLSNGENYHDGDTVWVEVEPIKWIIDKKDKTILSLKIILAGVQFNKDRNYHTKDFDKTDIKQFMDKYLSQEINQNRFLTQNIINGQNVLKKETTRKKNPYNFNFENVSEEDIIKGALESNVSVFLHGKSSEGKSARAKQLDPDCEIIYLRNASPESLNGKSVYNSNTGEMIDVPPTWFKKIQEKCKAEPDKIHIIFFDELTNAFPSVQGMAFNIILDGEVNGIWKLPENARIISAGNDLDDSLAANEMVEPLFNRFAHVYINTTVDSWLKWAVTPKNEYERINYQKRNEETLIHPAIYSYIAYKTYMGDEVLRTPFDGKKPNADPRKWEMASKVLYSTGKPKMLRALIGDDLTTDFTEFCRQQVITVQDVINNNYTDIDLEMNTSEQFATAVGLSSVDEENLKIVRDFVMKLGPEIVATFDNLWIHGDEDRLERIAELRAIDLSKGGMK